LLDPAKHRLGPGDFDAPGVRSPEWIHPWALTARTDERFRLGVLHAGYHRRFPWSPARWHFVITRMRTVCDAIIWLDPAHPGQLQAWRQFSAEHPGCMRSTLSSDYAELTRWPGMQTQPVPRLLPDPERACPSFSAFYKAATARLTSTPIR
jgi:deoxyribodipyrimidine photo-lyase